MPLSLPLILTTLLVGPSSFGTQPKTDPQADKILRGMSDFLSKQSKFSFSADHQTEAVLKSGQKLEFDAVSEVKVERPNRIRSDRRGEIAESMSFFYDGKNVSLYGRGANLYASTPAPANMDQAIDFAREKLDLETPAADLLYTNPYRFMTEDVVSGMYVGKATLDDKTVHHLAFRGNETDWQIWIEDGDKPLPRKYVIISKKVKGAPEFSVELRDWNFSPSFDSDTFAFTPPEDAGRIQFAGTPQKSTVKSPNSSKDTAKGSG
jgi:hypothetical protein